MFGWFSKPKQENEFLQLLAFGNDQYATTIGEMFTGMDRGIRAHVLVAYENLLPVLSATYSVAQQRGDDFTIEHFIPQIVEKLEAAKGNEIATRRWSWFLFAAMLGRLEKISFTNALAKIEYMLKRSFFSGLNNRFDWAFAYAFNCANAINNLVIIINCKFLR
mgnify:CR=1 FL=1